MLLRRQAAVDPLTGLSNRRWAFEESAIRMIMPGQRQPAP